MVERLAVNQKVEGSSPSWRDFRANSLVGKAADS